MNRNLIGTVDEFEDLFERGLLLLSEALVVLVGVVFLPVILPILVLGWAHKKLTGS